MIMKAGMTLLALAAPTTGLAVRAQEPTPIERPGTERSARPELSRAVRSLIDSVDPEGSPQRLADPLRSFVAADTSGVAEQGALKVLAIIETAETWTALRPRIEELLAIHHSLNGSNDPLDLAPAVIVLGQIAPDQPEVQAALVELFGYASAIHDAARALDALVRLPELLPRRGDRVAVVATKLLRLTRIVPHARAGWLVAEMLWGWLATAETTLASGGHLRSLSPSQLWSLNQWQLAERHHRSGNSAALQAALREWRKKRPSNRVPVILFACSQASLGPAYNLAHAKKTLATLPGLGDGEWRAVDSRHVLSRFGVPSVDETTLRQFCEDLKRSERAVTMMADRNWLKKRLPTQERKLEKKHQAFDQTISKLERSVRNYERAVGVRIHTGRDQVLDLDPSTAASQAATEWRDWYRAKQAAVRAQRQWNDERVKVDAWRNRLTEYERPPRSR